MLSPTLSSKTNISSPNSAPNLTEIYKPGKNDFQRRCFVTDATVATLPCMVDFIKNFTDGKCKNDELIILGSGEAYKNIESVLTIVKTAIRFIALVYTPTSVKVQKWFRNSLSKALKIIVIPLENIMGML